ncbi:MAG: Mce protein [Nocardiaceae bacterium]|nr:Mce protein [Nocardiaceae bacterium]
MNDDKEISDGEDASTVGAQPEPEPEADWLSATAAAGDAAGRVHRTAIGTGIALVLTLAALVGWLGFQVNRDDRASGQRYVFEQTARQGAIDLTTIDWRQADADVQRILAAATGPFHDDFAQRSQPFVDVIKQSQSVTTGTVTASGLESSTDDDAQVMVAVSVRTSSAGAHGCGQSPLQCALLRRWHRGQLRRQRSLLTIRVAARSSRSAGFFQSPPISKTMSI